MRTPTLLAGGLIAVVAAALLGWALLASESGAGDDPSGARRGGASLERIPTGLHEGGSPPAGDPDPDPDSEDTPATSLAGTTDPAEGDGALGDWESAHVPVRVVDTHGAPVSGATVEPYPIEPSLKLPRYRTDDDGRCELPTSGIYRFSAQRYATSVCPVGESGEPEAVVVMLARRELAGTVVSDAGHAVPHARVSAESATWYAELTTDADGAFRFVDAPQGEPTVFHVVAEHHLNGAFDESNLPQLVIGQGSTLRGRVVDSQGAPLTGARVRVFTSERLVGWLQTETDAAGGFVAGGLSPNEEFRVEVLGGGQGSLSPWQPFKPEIELRTGPLATLVIEACPANMTLELQPGQFVPAMTDKVFPSNNVLRGSGPGDVRFPDLIPGPYTLQIGDSYGLQVSPTTYSLEVEAQETRRAFSDLAPSAPKPKPDSDGLTPRSTQSLTVQVVDEQGAPVRWAQVNVTAGPVTAELGTDERGSCRFPKLPRAVISIGASTPGRVLVSPVTYDPEADSGEQVTVVLATPTVLSGSIGVAARPLLRLRPPEQPELERHFEGTPDGGFRWGGLPPGTYELEVSADGHVAQELTVELPLTRELQLRLELWRGHDHGHDDDHEDH